MLFAQFTRWNEQFLVEWSGRYSAAMPAGTLAKAVLRSLGEDEDAQERLSAWLERHGLRPERRPGHSSRHRLSEDALALVQQQLREWRDARTVSWDPSFSEIDSQGPTTTLSCDLGKELVAAITWRGPSTTSASEVVHTRRAEAAVLLSALKGSLLGTLVSCRRCQGLFTMKHGMGKRRKCQRCGALPQAHEMVDRCYKLIYDRVRNRVGITPAARSELHSSLALLRDEVRSGKTTPQVAVRRMKDLAPRNRRGRPTPTFE